MREAEPKRRYVQAVLDLYVSLPGTPARASRRDRGVAAALYDQGTPEPVVRAALLLAAARRTLRSPEAPPLPSVRTLFYFLPAIEEVRELPPDPDYVAYLEAKLRLLMAAKS